MLTHTNLLIIVSGSIAAYKSPDIVRRAIESGASVKVILTTGGAEFITRLSLETVGADVYTKHHQSDMPHISLGKWADIVLVAPASSNMIAKITHGESDDLATLALLSTTAPVYIAPAMNKEMLANSATQANIAELRGRGVDILPTGNGAQACGDMGYGRMLEPTEIITYLTEHRYSSVLSGKKVLLTVGATREHIDPVRYISNHSSGKMGRALAQECMNRGLETTVIYGNVSVPLPQKSHTISAPSALEMYEQVMQHINQYDIFIAVAAVSDYRAHEISEHKIKKSGDTLELTFTKNPDILSEVSQNYPNIFTVGFCAETEHLEQNAREKLSAKQLDMIVANYMSDGFGGETNSVIIMNAADSKSFTDTKATIAQHILNAIEKQHE